MIREPKTQAGRPLLSENRGAVVVVEGRGCGGSDVLSQAVARAAGTAQYLLVPPAGRMTLASVVGVEC